MPSTQTDDLNAAHALAGRVSFETLLGGPVAVLTTPMGGRAVVALQGAQLLSWLPEPQLSDVLWLSPVAALGNGKAVRGGVPVCWPWFGPHPNDASQPAHGLVRAIAWGVIGTRGEGPTTHISFQTETLPGAQAGWPFASRATLSIALSDTLEMTLTTENVGGDAFTLTEALHTYIRVSDVRQVSVVGLSGRRYLNQLTRATVPDNARAIEIAEEIDRIYIDSPDSVAVVDPALQRRVVITKASSQSTVVWNPWVEKAQRLGDVGADGYRAFVCVETANVLGNAVQVQPGATHQMKARLSVQALAQT